MFIVSRHLYTKEPEEKKCFINLKREQSSSKGSSLTNKLVDGEYFSFYKLLLRVKKDW